VCTQRYFSPEGIAATKPIVQASLAFVRQMTVTELSAREYEDISDVLETLKKLSTGPQRQAMDRFRLVVAEHLLESTTFNGRMNALKEVSRLCNDAVYSSHGDSWLTDEVMSAWLTEKRVVAVAISRMMDKEQCVFCAAELLCCFWVPSTCGAAIR